MLSSLPSNRNFDQICNRARHGSQIISVFSFDSVALILALLDNIFLREEEPGMVKRGGVSGMQFEAFHFLRSFCGKWPESRSIRTLLDLCSLSPFATIQMHIRFLYLKSGLELPLGESRRFCAFKGFRMVREQHSLAASLPSEKGKAPLTLGAPSIILIPRPPKYRPSSTLYTHHSWRYWSW